MDSQACSSSGGSSGGGGGGNSLDCVEPVHRNFEMCLRAVLRSAANIRFVVPIVTEDQLRSYEVLRFRRNPVTHELDEPYLENTVSLAAYREMSDLDNYPLLVPFHRVSEEEYDAIVRRLVFPQVPCQRMMSPVKYLGLCEKACRDNPRFRAHHFRAMDPGEDAGVKRCFSVMSRQEYLYLCRIANLPQYTNHQALRREDWL